MTYIDPQTKNNVTKDIPKEFKKPWDNFTVDARNKLEKIIVSFKQNLRIINKATNIYTKYENGKKIKVGQKGLNWAIRKPLHKETVFAKVSLRKRKTVRLSEALKDWKKIVDKKLKQEIKRLTCQYGKFDVDTILRYFKDRKYQFGEVDVSKVKMYYFDEENAAVRKNVDTSFTEKFIQGSVTDTGIQKILLNHLEAKGNKVEIAFSPEGIEEMNKNIIQLNEGKLHLPIFKVRVYETIGNKFSVGVKGNKKDKYVEAAKGTNLFFAIYVDENGIRSYETIPLNIVIERLKQGLSVVPEKNRKEHSLLFYLSPNDLVYVPIEDERENIHAVNLDQLNNEQRKRIYKMVSCTGSECHFVPYYVASPIVNKVEYSSLNKIGRSLTGEMIKDVCIKLKVDRLGNIKGISGL